MILCRWSARHPIIVYTTGLLALLARPQVSSIIQGGSSSLLNLPVRKRSHLLLIYVSPSRKHSYSHRNAVSATRL
ncbi:hypothetical protein BJY52DRAFT_1269409 [Lactarius psammicola]|nr:hypothetical protein BJY52DRAFT_1269409 [Lactarius psammicola]